jgi:transcriptional regulator
VKSVEEVAETLNISIECVKLEEKKALEKIRKALLKIDIEENWKEYLVKRGEDPYDYLPNIDFRTFK